VWGRHVRLFDLSRWQVIATRGIRWMTQRRWLIDEDQNASDVADLMDCRRAPDIVLVVDVEVQ
jgi:hypothetical protein